MTAQPTPLRCPACNTPLQITLQPAPYSPMHPASQTPAPAPYPPTLQQPPAPMPQFQPTVQQPPAPALQHQAPAAYQPQPSLRKRPLQQPSTPSAPASLRSPQPVPAGSASPPTPPAAPKKPRQRPHLSPQATLLGLGVLLLLAAGVTFLAVTWDSLPVAIQAAIMATLAAIALAGSVPASRFKLAGTAEALAILGSGLLAVDLYGARELGLIPPTFINGWTYAALSCLTVAAINLLMTRIAPKVITFGIAAVIVGQLPLPLFLINRVGVSLYLFCLLVQVVITLLWTTRGTRVVRITGIVCSGLVFATILLIGSTRALISLVASYSIDFDSFVGDVFGDSATALRGVLATAGVTCLAALAGPLLLQLRRLRSKAESMVTARALVEYCCVLVAAFTIACCLPQLPTVGRWATTAFATALALTYLLLPRRTSTWMLLPATTMAATVNLLVQLLLPDVLQLGLIAAIVAVLVIFAAWRGRLAVTVAAPTASIAAQVAILLGTYDGFLNEWTGGVALATVAACAIAVTCLYVGRAPESVLLATAASATVLSLLVVTMASPYLGTGVVLTIAAAPLTAYGMQPQRRDALYFAGLLLIVANTAFVLGAGATTLEWFTVPPAVVMLAFGLLRWADQNSWVYLGPGLLVGLVPSALIATADGGFLRLTLVIAAAVVVIMVGVRYSLQAPFVVGAAVIAKVGLWQFLDVAPLIPRWITLAAAGAILLTVGATYERRLNQAKHAARWVSSLR